MIVRCCSNIIKTQRLLSASNNLYINSFNRCIHQNKIAHRKSAYKPEESKKIKFFVLRKYFEYLKKYNNVLESKFPGAMKIYRVFMDGIRYFYSDVKLFIKIVRELHTPGRSLRNLKLHEIELYDQMPKDMIRVAPVLLISALPFANYVVFPLAYIFPRYLLCRHFWNLQQKSEFSLLFLYKRLIHNKPIFRHLQTQLKKLKGSNLHKRWSNVLGKIGSGVQPNTLEIIECKELFANEPYHLMYLSGNHIKHLAKLHDLRPAWFKRSKLREKALVLQAMDDVIFRSGISNLPLEDLRNACRIRGLNPANMRNEDMVLWLTQWINISKEIENDNLSLLLHLPILLGYNQPSNWLLVYSSKNK